MRFPHAKNENEKFFRKHSKVLMKLCSRVCGCKVSVCEDFMAACVRAKCVGRVCFSVCVVCSVCALRFVCDMLLCCLSVFFYDNVFYEMPYVY